MRVWGLIVAKRFERAKSRLAPVLDASARRHLAQSLFDHVLEILCASPALAGVAVVTDSPEVEELAAARHSLPIRDPCAAATLAACVDLGLDVISGLGADAALVFMSDLPYLRATDVRMLASELLRFDVVVARDERGEQTNALGLRLSKRLATCFGAPGSFHRHCEAARRAGLALHTPASPSIAFDIDTPEDFARYQRSLKRSRSSRTSSA